jgi:hypothetical protein
MEWKAIEDFPCYEVSSSGDVRRIENRKTLAPWTRSDGYVGFTLYKNGKPHTRKGHRLVAEAFLKDSHFEDAQVCHYDGTRTNNNLSNLRWGTAWENSQDNRRLGVITNSNNKMLGSFNGKAKLDEQSVCSIISQIENGISKSSIAASYGVNVCTIRRIASQKTWSHVRQAA